MGSSLSPCIYFQNGNRYSLDACSRIGRTKAEANEEGWSPSSNEYNVGDTPRTLPEPWGQHMGLTYEPEGLPTEDCFLRSLTELEYDPDGWLPFPDVPWIKDQLEEPLNVKNMDLSDQYPSPRSHLGPQLDQDQATAGNATRRHVCNQCRGTFTTGKDLEAHAKITKHRSYACSVIGCGNKYARRDVLLRHAAIHRNEWQWPCNLCGKAGEPRGYHRKDRLVQHLRTHHGPREAETFSEETSSKRKKSSSTCNDNENRAHMDVGKDFLQLSQSMDQIHRWFSEQLGNSHPAVKEIEPMKSRPSGLSANDVANRLASVLQPLKIIES